MKTRLCKQCNLEFNLNSLADRARKYCSQKCSKKAYTKQQIDWKLRHPDIWPDYNKNRTIKNPSVWRDKSRKNRIEILSLLGNKCIVCGVTNPHWLHVDFIPTTRNSPYRHPRNIGFIRKNLQLFRLLCANHHYELTLTGKIEGTKIEQ